MDPVSAVRVQRSRAFGVLSALATLGTILSLLAIPFTNISERGTPLGLAFLFGTANVLFLPLFWTYGAARRTPVSLVEKDGALAVGESPARRWSRGGATSLATGLTRIDLGWGLFDERLEVATPETARTVLASLGLDARPGTRHFRPRAYSSFPWILVATLSLLLTMPGFMLTGVYPVLFEPILLFLFGLGGLGSGAAFLTWATSKTDFTIGADGVEIRRWLTPRFIPWSRISRVVRLDRRAKPWANQTDEASLGFALVVDGKRIIFDTRDERLRGQIWQTDPIFNAVQKAHEEARKTATSGQSAAATLARGNRSGRDWLADLRARGANERSDYRVAALDGRALFDLLVDASATRELRAAAAVALAANSEHGPRLRMAVDDVADPVVRRVALAALDAEDDATAEALDEAAGPRRAPRRA